MEFSLDQLITVAEKVIETINNRASQDHAILVTFSGDLGAGKTTLIKEIAKQLGVSDELQSPTYVIYKRYSLPTSPRDFVDSLPDSILSPSSYKEEGSRTLIHGDMYRLESVNEVLKLGWNELLADPKNILLIEWPEKIKDVVPDWAIQVKLSHSGGNLRNIDII